MFAGADVSQSESARAQSWLEILGRRVMLVPGAVSWFFATSGWQMWLTAGMMILIWPIVVGLGIPVLIFDAALHGVADADRTRVLVFPIALTVVLVYVAIFGTLGWVKGFVAGTKNVAYKDFKLHCLRDKVALSSTLVAGAGAVFVTGALAALLVGFLRLIGLPI